MNDVLAARARDKREQMCERRTKPVMESREREREKIYGREREKNIYGEHFKSFTIWQPKRHN